MNKEVKICTVVVTLGLITGITVVANNGFLQNYCNCISYAPINVNPVGGGGSAGKGWGFDQEVKILVNCPRVGKHTFTKCS